MTNSKEIQIGNFKMGNGQPVFIIAEAGVNHNGSLKLAKQLIDAAKKAGADAVKFQTFEAEEVVTEYAPQAKYQKINAGKESQFRMLKKLELSEREFREISLYCGRKGIVFLSTPFSAKSADFLHTIGMSAFKISSGELTNFPFLRHVARFGKPIILSTGMATMSEVKDAVEVVYSAGNRNLTLLHCTSNYPTGLKNVNLKAIISMANVFNLPIGFSDHTEGIDIAPAAVALGAQIVEKHLTLNRGMFGPDHKASIDPRSFAQMVAVIRNVEVALGSGEKRPVAAEREMLRVARRSLVAAKDIAADSIISREMVTIKRPGSGIEPKYFDKVVGRKLQKKIKAGTLFSWKMLK